MAVLVGIAWAAAPAGCLKGMKDRWPCWKTQHPYRGKRLNIVGGHQRLPPEHGCANGMEHGSPPLQTAATSKALTSEGLKAANAAIATSKLIEENEKQVNEIYLAVFGSRGG